MVIATMCEKHIYTQVYYDEDKINWVKEEMC